MPHSNPVAHTRLIRNTTIYALGDIVPRLLSFVSFPILTRYLTPADYGIVSYVNTTNTFLLIVSLLCLNTYYLVYYYRQDDARGQAQLLGNLSIFIIVFNVLLSGIAFLCGNSLFGAIGANISFYPYIALGIATNFFNVLSILPMALFRVQERPLPLTILNILKGGLTFALTLLLVVRYHYTALGVLYSGLAIAAVFGLVFLWITNRHAIWRIDRRQLIHALRFSLPLLPGALSYYLVLMSDRVFIDKYLTLNDLGIYSTASMLALLLNIIVYGAYKAFEPYFFRIYGTDRFCSEFTKVKNGYLFILLCGALCLAIYAKEFFELFAGSEFLASYFYVAPILIGVVISAMTLMYSTVITAQNKTKLNSAITILGGIVSVGSNLLLVRHWGLPAACFTSAVSTLVMLELSVRAAGLKLPQIRSWLAVTVCSASTIFAVYILNIPSIGLSVLVKSFLAAITIWGLTVILRIRVKALLKSFTDKLQIL